MGQKFSSFMKKLRRGYRNLTVQWIAVACAVILPVNVLTVVITQTVADSYEEKITDSYGSQLKLYAASVDTELTYMQNQLSDFLTVENLAALIRGSSTDSTVQVTKFKQKLGDSRNWVTFCGFSFVWDHEKDIVSFFQQKKTYPAEVRAELEELLRDVDAEKASQDMAGQDVQTMTEDAASSVRTDGRFYFCEELLQMDGTAFLAEIYSFPYFSFGMLYDVKEILENYYESGGKVRGTVYLADGEGNRLSAYGSDGFSAAEETGMGSSPESSDLVLLAQAFGGGSYQLIQAIERKEILRSLPSLIRVLYVLTILSFIALPVLCIFAVRMVLTPLVKLCGAMEEVENGNLKYHLDGKNKNYQMDYLFERFNQMIDELNRLVISSYEREIEKLQTDAINMRLQVNQHMLLNFLNTIYSLAQVEKTEQVSEFTLLLMKYFRYVLRQDIALVPVSEEMQFVEDYLKIQKIRFPDSFVCVYEVDEEADGVLIPQLLIENFVENSVKYALVMGSEIEILINARVQEGKLRLSVCDTGNGMPKETLEQLRRGEIIENRTGKHIGIWNCRRRLKYYYGEAFELKITSSPGEGTQIFLELPLAPMETDEAARAVRKLESGSQPQIP